MLSMAVKGGLKAVCTLESCLVVGMRPTGWAAAAAAAAAADVVVVVVVVAVAVVVVVVVVAMVLGGC
jgi:hypothetical protein